LWKSLDSTRVIGDLAVEMIKVGESTGSLVEMLTNVSEFYDEEIEGRLSRMVAAIEPIILVFMGLVIGLFLLAFYLPLLQASGVGQG
jgi:type IV pilus assembly protein PilC